MITSESARNLGSSLLKLAEMKQQGTLAQNRIDMESPYYADRGNYYGTTALANQLKAQVADRAEQAKEAGKGGFAPGAGRGKTQKPTDYPTMFATDPIRASKELTAAQSHHDSWVKSAMMGGVPGLQIPSGTDPSAYLDTQYMQRYAPMARLITYGSSPEGMKALGKTTPGGASGSTE